MACKGFSLLELSLVLLIIGIVVSFSYPLYQAHMIQVRRYDGQSALLDLANRLERYYSEKNSYQSATMGTGKATDVLENNLSAGGWYMLSIADQTPSFFTLQAIPIKSQVNDKCCQTLTFTSLGEKGISHGPRGMPGGTVKECW